VIGRLAVIRHVYSSAGFQWIYGIKDLSGGKRPEEARRRVDHGL